MLLYIIQEKSIIFAPLFRGTSISEKDSRVMAN